MELAVAAEVNTQAHMLLFAPLLVTLTLLFLIVASPRNLPLETPTFTLPLTALTPKTQRSPPNWPPSLPRTMLPAVLSAGLYQVGYNIFATDTTNAAGRRPLGHLSMALTLNRRPVKSPLRKPVKKNKKKTGKLTSA